MAELEPRRPGRLLRLAARLLAPSKGGEVQALQQLLELRGQFRFFWVFLITVVLPGLALAYFSLSSLRSEEFQVRMDTERRAQTLAAAVISRSEALFGGFESAVRRRLESGRSVVDSVGEISPYLLLALRLDGQGRLAAPFHPPEEIPPVDQAAYFSDTWRAARRNEAPGGDSLLAAELYGEAFDTARGRQAKGQALFSRGRALMKASQPTEAALVFTEVVLEYTDIRDIHGFLLGDLARLKLSEIDLVQAELAGIVELQNLVGEKLAERWTIGRGGEAAIAARALELLEDRAPRDWLATARGRLEEKTSLLFWGEQLHGDLEELTGGGLSLPVETAEVSYQRIGHTLWATIWWSGDLYAFAFDLKELRKGIAALSVQAGRADASVVASLVPPDMDLPVAAMTRRSLAPWMPGWSVVVTPKDAQSLREVQRRKRDQRLGVILLSLLMIITGTVLTWRMIMRELEVARMKADFAANVSHELRSPITNIRLKGEFLQLGLVEEEEDLQAHYDTIVTESERLSSLVDNVLDFASIERGAKKYAMRPGDLLETIRMGVESARYAMETRGLVMEMKLPDDLPAIDHDTEAVRQVMQNLISNAAKYGEEGGWIGIECRYDEEWVRVSVADRGLGIAAEELPQIFDRFFRSRDQAARRKKGTGIGLTIVRYIMEAHNGRVSVASEIGVGTTFTLHFPLAGAGGSRTNLG